MAARHDKSLPSAIGPRRNDVVLQSVELDPADTFAVAAPDDMAEANRRAIRNGSLPAPAGDLPPPPADPAIQFSLRHLLIAQAVLAVMFALMRVLAPSLLAGALGVIVLVMAALVAIYRPQERVVLYVWYTTLALYLVACVMAAVSG